MKIFNMHTSLKRKRKDCTQKYTVSTTAAFLLDTFIHNVMVSIKAMTISDLETLASVGMEVRLVPYPQSNI